MPWGLPRSNELGWWSMHSSKSSPCTSSSGTSCAWISCASVPICSSYTDERIETLLDKIKVKLFYKVVNIIQGQYQEYMSSTTFSSVTNLRYFYTK
jgi:hypothetical protein